MEKIRATVILGFLYLLMVAGALTYAGNHSPPALIHGEFAPNCLRFRNVWDRSARNNHLAVVVAHAETQKEEELTSAERRDMLAAAGAQRALGDEPSPVSSPGPAAQMIRVTTEEERDGSERWFSAVSQPLLWLAVPISRFAPEVRSSALRCTIIAAR